MSGAGQISVSAGRRGADHLRDRSILRADERLAALRHAARLRVGLDRRAAGRSALRTDVLVLVALWQDEQEPLAHWYRAPAFGPRQQTCFHPLERRLPFRHTGAT